MVIKLDWKFEMFGRKFPMSRDLRPGEVIPVDLVYLNKSLIAEVKVLDDNSLEVTTTRGTERLIGMDINNYHSRLSMWDFGGKNVIFTWHWGKER